MSDYIKREDAIKAFDPKQRQDWYTPWIVETLKDLPSADVAPKWIPCKEKLPEYLDYVLLSSSKYGLKIGARSRKSNFNSWYLNEPLDCDVWHVILCNHMYDLEDFTAWMPLPEPYDGERKDDES